MRNVAASDLFSMINLIIRDVGIEAGIRNWPLAVRANGPDSLKKKTTTNLQF